MSNHPPRSGASSGVYIPPRRNAPPRPAPNGPPAPGGPPMVPPMTAYAQNPAAMIHPRTGSAVNIPQRHLSAAGLPERTGSISRPAFQAPPRTVYPGPGAPPNAPYAQPHSAQYTQSPAPYGNSAPYHQPHHGYGTSAGGYTQPMGGYVQPGTYGGAYVQPGAQPGGYVQPGIPLRPTNTPAPRVASLIPTNSYANEYFPPQPSTPITQPNHNVWMHPNQPLHDSIQSGDPPPRRRPSSIADASALYTYPEQQAPRPTSFDETRPFLENHAADTRTTGPTIPKRLGSNVPITVDDLLDAGGTAFAAPRHNVEEALAKWRQARNLAVEKGDLIREAKALSNIGAALRVQGRLHESLNELRTAWDVTTRYVQGVSGRSSSLWLQLVMRHADIDSDTEGAADVVTYASVNGEKGGMDIVSGPPIVVWYLQLTTNLGNGHFSLGQFQEAIQYYDMCRRMAEAVMEEYPLPASCPTPALSRNISGASTGSGKVGTPSTPTGEKGDPFDLATPTTPSPRIKLSYLHRQTLLAHARALSHLGLCHQQLGLDEEALDNNLKAESLVTFYSNRAQLSQSFQTRRSSLSHPYSQHLEVQAAEAAIIANVGTSYHAKGRLPTALQYHERSLKLFRNLPDEHGIAKQSINVGCLYMEVGKTLNTLHWIRDMDVASNNGAGGGDAELEACRRYWGPPRLDGVNIGEGAPDEGAPEVAGKGMFDMGMVALYEEERVFRIHSDWTGLMCVWLNLGYVLLHQPYLALYYLAKMTHDPSADSATTPTPNILRRIHPGTIPHFLHPYIHFTLSQSLYILTRMQEFHPDQPLFPLPAEEGTIPDHGTKLPVMDPTLVKTLCDFLGIEGVRADTLDQSTVKAMLDRCRRVLEGVGKVRGQVAQILVAGGGVGFDGMRQKGVITTVTEGKVEWSLAGRAAAAGMVAEAGMHYAVARECLAGGAGTMVKSVRGVDPGGGVVGVLDGSAAGSGGFLGSLLDLAAELTDPAVTDREEAIDLGKVVGSFMLSLAADMVASAVVRMKEGKDAGIDLTALLGATGGVKAALISRSQLLEAAKYLFSNQIGCCEMCAGEMIKALTGGDAVNGVNAEDVEVVFAGLGSKVQEGPRLKVFPCLHYKWQ